MVFGRMRAQAVICVAVLVLPGCSPNPAQDPATLAAIRAEARALMANPHLDASSRVPESHWPRTIGSLRPEWVRIDEDGVDIPVKVYFDDSWGYWVPRDPARLPRRRSGYRTVGEGIYWYHFS